MKSIYLRFMSDESSVSNVSEMVRVQSENEKLVHQISANEIAMKKMAQELKTERSKNTRLVNKVGVLSAKLKEVTNLDTPFKVKANPYHLWSIFFFEIILLMDLFVFILKECCEKGAQGSNDHQGTAVSFVNCALTNNNKS